MPRPGDVVLVDAGPLVALFNERDADHVACVETLQTLTGGLATVWPVITEAMFLLGRWPGAQARLWELMCDPDFRLLDLNRDDYARIRELMGAYADLPMDLADAALIRVAERNRLRTVFTLDHRGFRIYRPRHVRNLRLLP